MPQHASNNACPNNAYPKTKGQEAEEKRILAGLRVWKGLKTEKIAELLGVRKERVSEMRKQIQAYDQSQREMLRFRTPTRRRTKFEIMQDALTAKSPGYPDNQIAGRGCCHWIFGDGPFRPHGNWHYCNVPTGAARGVYCEEHYALAHPKPKI